MADFCSVSGANFMSVHATTLLRYYGTCVDIYSIYYILYLISYILFISCTEKVLLFQTVGLVKEGDKAWG